MLQVNNLVGFGGFTAAAGGKVLTYQTSTSDSTNASSYTFTAQAIGTAAADRYVIVGAAGSNTASEPSSVTVGGVSATKAVGTAGGNHSAGLWVALVTSGSTADIVVTWPGSIDRCAIGVWSATGLSSVTPSNTATSNASPGSCTVTTLADGFAIAYSHLGYGTVTWSGTGVTQDFNTSIEASVKNTGASAPTTGSNLTFTSTYSATFDGTTRPMVAASF